MKLSSLFKRSAGLIAIISLFSVVYVANGNDVDKSVKKDADIYSIINTNGNRTGTVISFEPDENDLSGYGGRIRVYVKLDNENKILSVEVGDNNETPGFIEMIKNSGFLNSWNGLNATEAMNKKVDTITGATMSTKAIEQMVKKNLSLYQGYDLSKEENKEVPVVLIFSVILLMYSVFAFLFPKKTARFRIIHLVMLVVLIGFLGGYSLSIETLKNGLLNGAFTIFSLVVFLAGVVFLMVKQKNFYCTHVCPFGAMQELAGRVPIPKISVSCRVLKIVKVFKRFLLYVIIAFLMFNVFEDYTVFEPFSAFQFKSASYFSLSIASVTLILSFFVCRPWCRFLCPTGEIFELMKPKICRKRNYL